MWVLKKQEAASENNWHIETHVCAAQTQAIVSSTVASAIPTHPTPPINKTLKRNFPCKTIKFKDKWNTQANIIFNAGSGEALLPSEAGPAVLITEAGGPFAAPHQHCRQLSSRPWGFSQYTDYCLESGSNRKHWLRPPEINTINLVHLLEESVL